VATHTTIADGLWSAAETWDANGVPVNDGVVVVNHDVTFNVDQSGFAAGMNGCSIASGKTVSFASDGTVCYLKMKTATNLSGAGSLVVGTQADPIPAPITSTPAVATISLAGGGEITLSGTVSMYGEVRDGRDQTAQSQASGDSTITLVTGFTLREGDVIAISAQTAGSGHTAHTVLSYNAGTKVVTLSSTLGRAVAAGDYVGLLTRNIVVTGDTTAYKAAVNGAASLSCTGVRFVEFGYGASVNAVVPAFAYCSFYSTGVTYPAGAGRSMQGGTVDRCVHWRGLHGGGLGTYFSNCLGFGGYVIANSQGAGNVFVGVVHCNGGSGNSPNGAYRGCTFYYCIDPNYGCAGARYEDCVFTGCTRCFCGLPFYALSRIIVLRNCLLGGTEAYGYTLTANPGSFCIMSYDHDQVDGAFQSYSPGGNCYRQAVVQRSGEDTIAMVGESANGYVQMWHSLGEIAAGATVTVDWWCSALDEWTVAPRAYLVYATSNPIIDTGLTPLDSDVVDEFYSGVGDRTWHTGQLTWTNTGDGSQDVMLVICAKDASAMCYVDWDVQSASGGGVAFPLGL